MIAVNANYLLSGNIQTVVVTSGLSGNDEDHRRSSKQALARMAVGMIQPPGVPLRGGSIAMGKLRAWLWSRKWFVLAAITVVGIGGWQGALFFMGPEVAVDQAKRAQLIETVVATGSVQTPFRVLIGSQISGTVEEVQVDEGQRVTKGQKLVSLESHELVAAVDQAQAAVAQAEAHMTQLKDLTLPTARDALNQAQATFLNAQQSFSRAQELARTGNETRVVLDAAQKDLDVARTQVRSAELQVNTASPGGSDYVTGQTQLNQARALRVSASPRSLGLATRRSPRHAPAF